jgi:hypothetical protein
MSANGRLSSAAYSRTRLTHNCTYDGMHLLPVSSTFYQLHLGDAEGSSHGLRQTRSICAAMHRGLDTSSYHAEINPFILFVPV